MDKEIKNNLIYIEEKRKEQIKHFENLFIVPLKDNIKISEGVRTGTESMERYLRHCEIVTKRMGLLKGYGN